jgi:hypothetical protein
MLQQVTYWLTQVNGIRGPGAVLALVVGILLAVFGVVHARWVIGALVLVALLFSIAAMVGGAPQG